MDSNSKPQPRRTSIYLYQQDDAAIAVIKDAIGADSDAAVIRYALRTIVQMTKEKEDGKR